VVNGSSVVPENCEHAFSNRRLSPGFFLSRRCGMSICK
jgi:hypothetical protein